MPPFVRWGPGHLGALAVTLVVPLLLAWWSRHDRTGRIGRIIAFGFATLLLGEISTLFFWIDRGANARWQDMLPLQLCDLTLLACALACVTRNRFAYEIAYFWGLAGSIQGLITPDLAAGFPSAPYWFFFIGHGGIVGSVLFLTAGLGLRPHWFSAVRAFAAALVYALAAGLFDAIFHTNYGYLCEKPAVASLLDWFGPWPWYIVSMAGAGVVLFTLLYLPWAVADGPRNDAK